MSRDHRKLLAFQAADNLVIRVYEATQDLPPQERYGLQSQVRRAAVSVATNIVEGSSRPTTADYCRFLNLSLGSAREVEYLLDLTGRLGYIPAAKSSPISADYNKLCATLLKIVRSLSTEP